MGLLLQREEEGALTPLLTHGKVHFLWIKHANLYLVATTKKNGNASLVYSFLYKVVEVFCEYFKELEEESIRDNFVIIYELLDELMDFGFPQTTDSKILQEYITQEGNKLETGKSRVPTTVTNAVSWRSEGIKYKKNEVFIDVIESVNLLVSANGSVLLSEVVGTIKLKVFLSGMPELRLGLNDRVLFELTGRECRWVGSGTALAQGGDASPSPHHPPDTVRPSPGGKNKSVELEDVKFHQCVRLSRFDNDRTISFIPPDGDFELMSYRLNTQVKPLIWIESVIEKFSHSRVEIMVKAKGQFKKQSVANGVEIAVPVPSDADSPKFKTSVGSARYLPERNLVIWTIKSFPVRLPTPPIPNAGVPLVGFSPSRLPRRVARHRPQPHGCCAGGKGAPDARPLRSAQRGEGGGGGSAPHLRPLRDSLLHRLGHPGAVHEDHREERVPGAALGALHHPERGLPAPHQLRAGGGAPRTTMDTPPSGHPPRAPPPPLCL
ncbi:AP-1 complex subunit mu-2 isoform 11-T11 [Morphnus guianensis]